MMGGGGFPGMMMEPGMMMTTMARPQTGSAVVDSGWQSGSSITIMLEGDEPAHDASDIHVIGISSSDIEKIKVKIHLLMFCLWTFTTIVWSYQK